MSRLTAPRASLALVIALLSLVPTGCIFSPKEDKGGCTENCAPEGPPKSETELIQKLASAYQLRSVPDFNNLFPTDDQAEYLFILNEPDPIDGSTSWGRTVELRVHQRMFRPEETPPGEPAVDPDLYLQEVSITLIKTSDFEERTDLYQGNGGTLDPARWRATDAEYQAILFFQTAGETDYSVDGRANFVVINDLSKAEGTDRKFLIYRWEDLGAPTAKPAPTTHVPAL